MSISGLMEQIRHDEIVLPAIQRDFVWNEDQIEKLFDSIMRGYPIGIAQLWETYDDIQYRFFVRDYRQGSLPEYHGNSRGRRNRLVLDGQQRLQALYIALHGKHEGKYLYFDVLSGYSLDDATDERYFFIFKTPKDALEWNKQSHEGVFVRQGEERRPDYLCKVQDLIMMGRTERLRLRKQLSNDLSLSEDDIERLELNLQILNYAVTANEELLKVTTLDANKPKNSPDRRSESDVLEAFVRINRQGTPLRWSDLIFSMLKLKWRESAETLPEFVAKINKGNQFELDTDFVMRCLFAVSDLGVKFNVDLLRKSANVEQIKANFARCCDAIRATVDFVQGECHISSSRLLGGYFNLIPLVYYLFHRKKRQVPPRQVGRIKKAVYLFGFTSPFSRYADSRLARFISEEMKPLVERDDDSFPLEAAMSWIRFWEKYIRFDTQVLQNNPILALSIVQGLSGIRVQLPQNLPEVDHIFPRSELRTLNFDEGFINHYANLWILAKGRNRNKSNSHPKQYFRQVTRAQLKRAYINPRLLDYKHYRAFLKQREVKIFAHVCKWLNLTREDLDLAMKWENNL